MKNYTIQSNPFKVPTNDGKTILEHFGNVANEQAELSMAFMIAPPQWSEPFQTPEFDEYTFIISGKKQFIIEGETIILEKVFEKNTKFTDLEEKEYDIPKNSDLVIKGLGFINIKKACKISINTNHHDLIEIRPSMYGDDKNEQN